MLTPLKTAPGVLGALALALVAGTVQANNPAYRTAKNGWSTEHSCTRDGEVTGCWTMTRGKPVLSYGGDADAGASLIYGCNTRNAEWLYFSMFSAHSPKRGDLTLKARWGRELTASLEASVTKEDRRRGSLYNYLIEDTHDFIRKMKEHRTLNVFLPFPGGQPYEVRFKLANAVPSIQQTMKACHIHRSALGDIHL